MTAAAYSAVCAFSEELWEDLIDSISRGINLWLSWLLDSCHLLPQDFLLNTLDLHSPSRYRFPKQKDEPIKKVLVPLKLFRDSYSLQGPQRLSFSAQPTLVPWRLRSQLRTAPCRH